MKPIYYYKDGTTSEELDEFKTLHREDGPAIIGYHEDGSIECEEYHIEGRLHREDGPALIEYYEDGSIWYEQYCIEDKLHREDGPTSMGYYKDGSIDYEYHYIEEKYLSKEDFLMWRLSNDKYSLEELHLLLLDKDREIREFAQRALRPSLSFAFKNYSKESLMEAWEECRDKVKDKSFIKLVELELESA